MYRLMRCVRFNEANLVKATRKRRDFLKVRPLADADALPYVSAEYCSANALASCTGTYNYVDKLKRLEE